MSGLSASSVAAILEAHDFGDPRKVVDVGDSLGVFLAGVLNRYPQPKEPFDLPQVVAEAGPSLEQAGVAERVERAGGDFLEAVPAGGDFIS